MSMAPQSHAWGLSQCHHAKDPGQAEVCIQALPSSPPGSWEPLHFTVHAQGRCERAELFATIFFSFAFLFFFYPFIKRKRAEREIGESADPHSPFNSPKSSAPALPYFASCWGAAVLIVSTCFWEIRKCGSSWTFGALWRGQPCPRKV